MKRSGWLVVIVLAGCVSAPPVKTPELPVEVPESWTVGDELVSLIAPEWWRDFDDPTLDRIVAEALASNYDLAIAAARLSQAEADAKVAAADLYPHLNVNASGSRRKQNFIGFPIPGSDERVLSTTSTNLGVNLQASWEADLWGRIEAGARAALSGYQATAADLDGARLSVAGQSAKAWFAAAEATEQLRLARATVESFREAAERVRERFEAGIRPSLDYRLALANLAAAEAVMQQRANQLDLTKRQIETLLGRYPGAEVPVAERLAAVPPLIPRGVPSEIVARRPDLTAAERRLVASGELVSVARRARYPRLSLTASGGSASRELLDLVDGDFSVWSLVGNLVQPIFEGGRLRANVDRAEASEEESLAAYVRAVLDAYLEVESALAAEGFLAERERALAEASQQSKAAEQLALDRYRQGLSDYITVLESQRRAFEAESAYIASRRQRLDNRIDLYLALGGGFDRERHPELRTETEEGVPHGF